MEDLLPHYERELAWLRSYGREFAGRYPKIASRLLLSADGSQDPHVERLVESFALLSARISKKIEDDYPEFTEALLEVLYPHYLRPFPSCSIASFDMGPALSKLAAPVRVPRHTLLHSRPVRGVACRFRTAYEVTLAPVRVAAARFLAVAEAPLATSLPQNSGGQLSLDFELLGECSRVDDLGLERLRVFTDGDDSVRAALRDTLACEVHAAYVELTGSGRWQRLDAVPLEPVGFHADEALVDYDRRSQPAYRLLTELFAFPEKFGFHDIDLRPLRGLAGASFTLHLILRSRPGDAPATRVLEGVCADNFRLGCTPVVNLFEQPGEPIRIHHRSIAYPVVADARRAFAYEVVSIDSVKRTRQGPQGEHVTEFRPFYALHHGETPDDTGHYWLARRDEQVARSSPGYETELSFVDLDFNPVQPQTDVVSLHLTCSNRDLPAQLAYGVQGGDLTMEGGGPARVISLLRKPTPTRRFERGRGLQWRLVSHLALNHLSLAQDGLPAFKEMLRLYDMARTGVTRRQVEGVTSIEHIPTTAWLPGRSFASVVRGVEIRLGIDEAAFVGQGISAFARVLDHFFGLYVHANSFTRLVLVSAANDEELLRCEPRSGDSMLA